MRLISCVALFCSFCAVASAQFLDSIVTNQPLYITKPGQLSAIACKVTSAPVGQEVAIAVRVDQRRAQLIAVYPDGELKWSSTLHPLASALKDQASPGGSVGDTFSIPFGISFNTLGVSMYAGGDYVGLRCTVVRGL